MKSDFTILIVDDDEDDKKLFIESAKEVDENITCITATDGQEALRYLEGTRANRCLILFLWT